MRFIVDVMSAVLEVVVLNYFFKTFLNSKDYKLKTKILINVICITLFTLISTYFLSSQLSPLLNFSVVVLLCFLKFDDKALNKLLWILIIFTLTILSEILAGIFISIIYKVDITESQENIVLYLFGEVFSKLMLFLIFRVFGYISVNKNSDVSFKSVLAVFMIPLSSVLSFYYITVIAYEMNNKVLNIFLLVITSLIILSNISTFYLIERQAELQKAEQDLQNLEKQYRIQSDYYAELKENMILTNKNVHDIKNFVTAISSYLDMQKTDKAKEKIEEFYGKIPAINTVQTGNEAVNALLQSKMKTINENIPNNNVSIMCPELHQLDEIDLCIIIGNAIDNAMEACEGIEEKKKRFLTVKIFPTGDQISMLFENSRTEIIYKSFMLTTKPNKYLHGYGTANMKRLCEKYDGSIVFEQKKDKFSVSILIPA